MVAACARPGGRGSAARGAARLDEPSETEAEHRERGAEVAAGEEGRVAAVDLEPESSPVREERIPDGERDAGREAPPPVEPERSGRRVHARVAPGDCRAPSAQHATRPWRRRHAPRRATTRGARTATLAAGFSPGTPLGPVGRRGAHAPEKGGAR